MNFISKRDFDALWNAMDLDRTGRVDAVEFVVFLSACGPEFEQVYEWQTNMPKMERLKLAARRLSIIAKEGESGAKALEHRLERSSGAFSKGEPPVTSSLRGDRPIAVLEEAVEGDHENNEMDPPVGDVESSGGQS